MHNWKLLFEGDIEGRPVELRLYEEERYYKVTTTQLETETTESYRDGSDSVFPGVISEGDKIEVDAPIPFKLYKELRAINFSRPGAHEIARHAIESGDPDLAAMIDAYETSLISNGVSPHSG